VSQNHAPPLPKVRPASTTVLGIGHSPYCTASLTHATASDSASLAALSAILST
jgi:hypothetical protein